MCSMHILFLQTYLLSLKTRQPWNNCTRPPIAQPSYVPHLPPNEFRCLIAPSRQARSIYSNEPSYQTVNHIYQVKHFDSNAA